MYGTDFQSKVRVFEASKIHEKEVTKTGGINRMQNAKAPANYQLF